MAQPRILGLQPRELVLQSFVTLALLFTLSPIALLLLAQPIDLACEVRDEEVRTRRLLVRRRDGVPTTALDVRGCRGRRRRRRRAGRRCRVLAHVGWWRRIAR